MIVREKIEFKRNIDPKRSLDVGIKKVNEDPENLEKNFREAFAAKGLFNVTVVANNPEAWVIFKKSPTPNKFFLYFDIDKTDFIKFFKNKENMIGELGKWLDDNAGLTIDKYNQYKEKFGIIEISLVLK